MISCLYDAGGDMSMRLKTHNRRKPVDGQEKICKLKDTQQPCGGIKKAQVTPKLSKLAAYWQPVGAAFFLNIFSYVFRSTNPALSCIL